MGLPLYREPPAAPRETDRDRDRDPTASARSHIRRRVHSRRVSASDALRRAGLDRDRRSSQQVLLDLLQFTQDNSSSSASVNSASSTAATVASSTASTGSVSGSASTPYAPSQAPGSEPGSRTHPYSLHRRDFSIQLPRPSFEIYRDEPAPLAYGATQSHPYLLPPFVPNNVRVIRHSSATEPPLLPDRDREHERDSNQVDREAERAPTTEESDSTSRNLRAQLSFDVYSSRMGSLYGRDEEEQPSYVRESSRRFHRTSDLTGTFDSTRERMRDMASAAPTVPEVMSAGEPRRRGENVIDGLGDRARSLRLVIYMDPVIAPAV